MPPVPARRWISNLSLTTSEGCIPRAMVRARRGSLKLPLWVLEDLAETLRHDAGVVAVHDAVVERRAYRDALRDDHLAVDHARHVPHGPQRQDEWHAPHRQKRREPDLEPEDADVRDHARAEPVVRHPEALEAYAHVVVKIRSGAQGEADDGAGDVRHHARALHGVAVPARADGLGLLAELPRDVDDALLVHLADLGAGEVR